MTAGEAGQRDRDKHRLTTLTYLLHLLGLMTVGGTTVVALIVNYAKRASLARTIYASHFTWQIRSGWWFLGLTAFCGALMFLGDSQRLPLVAILGALVWLITCVWFVYRVLKGYMWLTWNEEVGAWRRTR